MPVVENDVSANETFALFKTQLTSCLIKYCNEQLMKAKIQGGGYDELWQAIINLIKIGGKRMRPYLLMQAYEMYGGKDFAATMPAAAAQELLHLSMLVHDDIIDRDDMRYGILNVGGTYKNKYISLDGTNAEHYANSAALLAGDILLSSAYNIILESTMQAGDKVIAARQLAQSITAVVGGELTDMESALYSVADSQPLKTAEHKTAIYSFVGPLCTGALLAGAPNSEIMALSEYGTNLGVAFQLTDDILGIFGDENVTGKSALSDLQEGKRTYLMNQAFARADDQQRSILERLNGLSTISVKEALVVRDIIIKCGALDATQEMIKELSRNAETALNKLSLQTEQTLPLKHLILSVTERNK